MNLTNLEKCRKLLEFSVVLKQKEKKAWLDMLPKMQESQVQTLYDVLVDEVKAWKKEGISIIPDMSLESRLMPTTEVHGASIGALKHMLDSEKPTSHALKNDLAKPVNTRVLGEDEVETSIPTSPSSEASTNSAWMLNNRSKPAVQTKSRNKVPRYGLADLSHVKEVDDLMKIEPAHLRQGPLPEQIAFIKKMIGRLAAKTDTLPINILPVFEQSPLFKTYLKAGAMLIDKNVQDKKFTLEEIMGELESGGMDSLTQTEFEAIADLKKELEVMAGL